ncbi:4,5-DOPA dioxygenase extradiol [Pedobacter sp. CAN_A7]|uniref:4,5-DOPA-extradiol-dioxygenase n=1 Tax=Pedobacter sp. CAN_A7 TaxID=2787722 RepID=UPI001A227DBA
MMSDLSTIKNLSATLQEQETLMPVFFIGHGSPMNGIEDNVFSREWAAVANDIPQPKAVIVVSAHWFTRGTFVTAMDFPQTIHDFGGFPQDLFDVQYPAPGDPQLAAETVALVKGTPVGLDHDWGLDHGAWTVVRHMYPLANIPVLQLSMDYTKSPADHYALAKELYSLRKKGVLIMGSGNMVHNLRMMDWSMINGGGFDWALDINERFKTSILSSEHDDLIHFDRLGQAAKLAIPTPEHYLPLLYTLALKNDQDQVTLFNDKAVAGSLTMTSVRIG